jgi:hypothetical protein
MKRYVYDFERTLIGFSKLHRQWAIPPRSLVTGQQLTVSFMCGTSGGKVSIGVSNCHECY